jgi:hypothetical protein
MSGRQPARSAQRVVASEIERVRTSVGIELTALAVVFAVAVPADRVRHLRLVAGGLAGGMPGGWAVTGQDWVALPEYAYHAGLIVAGYASAMSSEEPGLGWHKPLALLAFAIVMGGVLHASRPALCASATG